MTEPQPLDYRPASLTPHRRPFSVTAFLAVGIPLSFLYAMAIFVVPKFETIFKDFGMKLPLLTHLMFNCARYVANTGMGWIVPIVLPLGAGFVVPVLVQADPRNLRRRRNFAMVMAVVALLVMLIILVIALALPMFALGRGISSPAKR
jgi:hypothetical protein